MRISTNEGDDETNDVHERKISLNTNMWSILALFAKALGLGICTSVTLRYLARGASLLLSRPEAHRCNLDGLVSFGEGRFEEGDALAPLFFLVFVIIKPPGHVGFVYQNLGYRCTTLVQLVKCISYKQTRALTHTPYSKRVEHG